MPLKHNKLCFLLTEFLTHKTISFSKFQPWVYFLKQNFENFRLDTDSSKYLVTENNNNNNNNNL